METRKIKVILNSTTNQVRTVEVPLHEWYAALDDAGGVQGTCQDIRRDLVFKYGQNDFQPQRGLCSVSVGDVILFPGSFWRVDGCGFTALNPDEFVAHVYGNIARNRECRVGFGLDAGIPWDDEFFELVRPWERAALEHDRINAEA